jgi:HSP20 family molecular chaperone IbpA
MASDSSKGAVGLQDSQSAPIRKALARIRGNPHILGAGCHNGALRNGRSLKLKDVSMTKLTLGSHPYMLGFEQLERMLERSAKSGNEGYPPFNIEQTSQNSYRITLAVAGFSEEDLAITVEDRQLVIRGRQGDDAEGRIYLHRGIAARQFQRSFVLADGVEVGEAIMENGLLHVDLTRAQPEPVVQKIRINKG